MEWRDGLGKALQDERPDQSTSNGPISDFVASSIPDAAVRDTRNGDPPSQGCDFSLCSAQLPGTSRPTRQSHTKSFLVLFSATKSNTGDFSVEVIRILMFPH